MKRFSFLILFLIPLILFSQEDTSSKGIKWTSGLSWEQVKQKAKAENKYIFLDCYATWCGPCKMMDKEVYIKDSVGLIFNDKFISVKVQMDRTKNDDPFIQSWYADANAIGKQYHIEGFPSFVFLSPEGKRVYQTMGYMGPVQFIETGISSIQISKVYDDPYAEYDRLLVDYKNGILHYDRMWYMIQAANKFDAALARNLNERYLEYIDKLDENQRYQKDIIAFWTSNVLNTRSKVFSFFYKNEKKVNEVMQRGNYVMDVIDKAVYNEIVVPFFNEQNKNPIIPMTGMILGGINPDYSEADWKKLDKTIRHKFNKTVANRNVLASRIEWYTRYGNLDAAARTKLIQLKKYSPGINNQSVLAINSGAWNAFKKVSDKKILNGYIKWMQKVVKKYEIPEFLDTYACLLYKVGKTDEAILWESKAAFQAAKFSKVVEQMRRKEPVYGVKSF